MSHFVLTRQIAAPIDQVFAQFTDFPRLHETVSSITATEMLTDGPVALGTRFRETRTMFGRDATEEMEITNFEPPRAYTLGAENHGCRYRTNFNLQEKDGGTEVRMEFNSEPLTLMAKIMTFIMKPMMKTILKECSKDLDDLKARLEASA